MNQDQAPAAPRRDHILLMAFDVEQNSDAASHERFLKSASSAVVMKAITHATLCVVRAARPISFPLPRSLQRAKRVAGIRGADQGACVHTRLRYAESTTIGPTA